MLRILLIGDSIKHSYRPHVARLLQGRADLVGPDDIAYAHTRTTLGLIEDVLAISRPDVVHWNNGLHDIKRDTAEAPCQVPLEEYRANLDTILAVIREVVNGRLIWALTTPVIEERHNNVKDFIRLNADIDAYNATAYEIMQREDVPIDDLHAALWARREDFIVEDGVHLNETGQRAAAQAVVESLAPFLRGGGQENERHE